MSKYQVDHDGLSNCFVLDHPVEAMRPSIIEELSFGSVSGEAIYYFRAMLSSNKSNQMGTNDLERNNANEFNS